MAAMAAWGLSVGLFMMSSSIGCGDSKEGSGSPAAKSASGGHDHAGHSHDHGGHGDAADEDKASPAGEEKIAQKLCPVTGKEIDPESFTVHEGRKVYFCCAGCIEEFKKEPDKYLAKLEKGE